MAQMKKPKKKSTREWNPSGKYRNVTPTDISRQVEILSRWVKILKVNGGIGPARLPKKKSGPDGLGDPPPFP